MTVNQFDISKGLYIFEFEELDTEFHKHPAIEIIIAKTGSFSIWTDTNKYENLVSAIIPANQKHKVHSKNGELKIIMIEHHDKFVIETCKLSGLDLSKGYFAQSNSSRLTSLLENLVYEINAGHTKIEYDFRITETIEYLNKNDLEYALMVKTLRAITNLSESRLSHLFKSTIGISLKRYLIWSKLKSTIYKHLEFKDDLFTALVKSGFYDQPHFSKNFKNMLGVKPSKAYNSRNIQDSKIQV